MRILNALGQALDLTVDQTLLLEFGAGLLDLDTLPGGFAFPFSFPIEAHPPNQLFLAGGYRGDAGGAMELPVTLTHTGVLDRPAVLRYEIRNGEAQATLRLDYNTSTDALKDQNLSAVLTDPIYLGVTSPEGLPARLGVLAARPAGSFPCTFFPLRNPDFLEADLDNTKLTIPALRYTRPVYNSNYTLTGFQCDSLATVGRPVVPYFYLSWVVGQLLQKLGYTMAGSWAADPYIQSLVVVNQTAMNSSVITGISPLDGKSASEYWVRPGLHLPDVSVSEFLRAVRGRFGLRFAWDSRAKVCRVDALATLLQAGAKTVRDPLRVSRDSLSSAPRTGLSLSDYVDSNDRLRTDPVTSQLMTPPPIRLGDGTGPQELKIGTTSVIRELRPDGGGAYWEVPCLDMPGNLMGPLYQNSDRYADAQGNRRNTCGFTLLSYEGMQPDSLGRLYPKASAITGLGTVDSPRRSLALGGRTGSWQTGGLRAYYQFRLQARPYSTTRLLHLAEALALRPGDKLSLDGPDGERITALLDTMQLQLPAVSGRVRVRLDCLTVPPLPLRDDTVSQLPLVFVEVIRETRKETLSQDATPTQPSFVLYHTLQTMTVKIWADRAKTKSASLSGAGLRLNTRKQVHYEPTAQRTVSGSLTDSTSLDSVVVAQPVQVIVANLEIERTYFLGGILKLEEGYTQTVQLDPGEDYILL